MAGEILALELQPNCSACKLRAEAAEFNFTGVLSIFRKSFEHSGCLNKAARFDIHICRPTESSVAYDHAHLDYVSIVIETIVIEVAN